MAKARCLPLQMLLEDRQGHMISGFGLRFVAAVYLV